MGFGVSTHATAEPAGQPHQVGVFERLIRSRQRPPPHPEPARIMAHAEIDVQNDPVDAIVAAGQQILIESAQPVRHPRHVIGRLPSASNCPAGATFSQLRLRKRVLYDLPKTEATATPHRNFMEVHRISIRSDETLSVEDGEQASIGGGPHLIRDGWRARSRLAIMSSKRISTMHFSQFSSPQGRHLISEKLEGFNNIYTELENIYDKRPFDQQSAASLLQLWLLVMSGKPMSIFELGTGSRASTIALALAAAEVPGCTVYGVDIAPRDFRGFTASHFPTLQFGSVVDKAVEATTFAIPDEWERPILMFYDAHDGGLPGKIISRHAISSWFPKLSGQTVVIHDCLVLPNDAPTEYPSPYHGAIHWSGQKIIGFAEVGPLMEWMNRERIEFWQPGEELAKLGFPMAESYLIAFTAP